MSSTLNRRLVIATTYRGGSSATARLQRVMGASGASDKSFGGTGARSVPRTIGALAVDAARRIVTVDATPTTQSLFLEQGKLRRYLG